MNYHPGDTCHKRLPMPRTLCSSEHLQKPQKQYPLPVVTADLTSQLSCTRHPHCRRCETRVLAV